MSGVMLRGCDFLHVLGLCGLCEHAGCVAYLGPEAGYLSPSSDYLPHSLQAGRPTGRFVDRAGGAPWRAANSTAAPEYAAAENSHAVARVTPAVTA